MLGIYGYGTMMALGILLSMYYFWKMGRDEHLEEISLFDVFFLSLFAYYVAGRAGYVAMHWADLGNLGRALGFLSYPGLNEIAGIVGASVAMIFLSRAKDWEVWKILDMYAVSLSLVMIFGSIGAWINNMLNVWQALIYLSWALASFMLTISVRKNFRFYDWYKRNASVPKEGLSALFMLGSLGVLLSVSSIYPQLVIFRLSSGLATILVAVVMVMKRAGVKLAVLQWRRK